MDELSQGHFGIAACFLEHKIQAVVPQEGGVGVHLLHGYLYGRAQPLGTEGVGNVPGSLEANEQPVTLRPIAVLVVEESKCELEH